MNSQWKNRKTRNIPPPASRGGADISMAAITAVSPDRVACITPQNPSEGLSIYTMMKGRTPRTTKTANNMPQKRNHRRAFLDMVERTSAFMTALSMLLTISKIMSPATVNSRKITSTISDLYVFKANKTNHAKASGKQP